MFVLDCTNPCRFLGGYENEPQQVDAEKSKIDNSVINEEKQEERKTENSPVTCCSSCNVEMSQTRTKFTIDGWEKSGHNLDDDSSRLGAEVLPVMVFLCPKCGKIDFRADEKLIKKLLF
jgi:predicted RNA-binding Zn-ribbon protein involved in translation (DUF1610 family)